MSEPVEVPRSPSALHVRRRARSLAQKAFAETKSRRINAILKNVANAVDEEHRSKMGSSSLAGHVSIDALLGIPRRASKVRMKSASPPPQGVAWVRVQTNLRPPDHWEQTFFVPYFGETEENLNSSCALADELMHSESNDAESDSGPENVANGKKHGKPEEVDDSDIEGNHVSQLSFVSEGHINKMWDTRAKRVAVHKAAKGFPPCLFPQIVSPLAETLKVSNEAILKYRGNARIREKKWRSSESESKVKSEHNQLIFKIVSGQHRPSEQEVLESNSISYFLCRRCYTFDCALHGVDHPRPNEVPYDRTRKEFASKQTQQEVQDACPHRGSGACWYSVRISQDRNNVLPTSSAQLFKSAPGAVLYLSEFYEVFGDDCCRLAAMMHTNPAFRQFTCAQVGHYVENFLAHGKGPANNVLRKGLVRGKSKSKSKRSNCVAADRAADGGKRKDYEQCKHDGPCTPKNCPCKQKDINCEKYCCCNNNRVCGDRFHSAGNSCANISRCHCKSSAACMSNNCACYSARRECDPDLCKNCMDCKIDEAGNMQARSCHNSGLRMNDRKRVVVGRSNVHGWGAYAATNIKKNDLIGEYVGEIVEQNEAERRGRVYDEINCSYLFNITELDVIDSTRLGNKLRYCNHSKSPNCFPQLMRVGGDVRVGLYAKRDIPALEELFFDYSYNETGPSWAVNKSRGYNSSPKMLSRLKSPVAMKKGSTRCLEFGSQDPKPSPPKKKRVDPPLGSPGCDPKKMRISVETTTAYSKDEPESPSSSANLGASNESSPRSRRLRETVNQHLGNFAQKMRALSCGNANSIALPRADTDASRAGTRVDHLFVDSEESSDSDFFP